MSLNFLVAIAKGLAKEPIARLDAGFHFLDDLPAVLFALQLALTCQNQFDELTLGRVIKDEVQAFGASIARRQFAAQLAVEFGVTRKAFEIVEDDYVVFSGLCIEEAQQRHHSGAVHEVASARNIIWEYRFDVVALRLCVFSATFLLPLQTMPARDLRDAGNTAINDRWLRRLIRHHALLLGWGCSGSVADWSP
ncbi:MAG: hypothetical protein P1U66_14100 [Thalassobius sp.]|nr:hypothetical protein [Thalassovita sp.]MDF1803989.1 hypothetical protein [Thalassovita sp.]